ncbi:MAG: hypothetical protein KAS82_06875 [Bacteroidales bacterium]|nr:hypothetical protein [Bacteroidales bacterium]
MMKYITHCLAVSMFFLSFSLSGQDVEISIDHPDRVNAGEDFTVTVTIKKGSLTDYSRFSQDIPLGLSATNVSSPNADFSFDEQRVRIIWLKMPDASEISVSYLLSVDSRLKGTFNLGGVFAYVVDEERKFLNFDQINAITIVPNRSIDPALIVDIRDFRGGAAVVPAAVSTGTGFAMAVRQKPLLLNTGGYLVHILIDNPSGSKYAKVEETIPSGYLFEEVNSNEGIVSHAASTVKFIWMKLPEQSEFEVVYRLVPKQNEPQGNMLIEGLLTYTAGNENRVAEIVQMDVSLDNLTTAQKRNLLDTGTVPAGNKTAPAVKRETRPPSTSTNVGSASDRVIVNTRVLNRGTGVYYRVQLTANLNAFDATTYYRQAGVDREVLVEQHQGLYKYTIGPFQSYDQALSYKEKVDRLPEIEGAFIIGYQNGNRVATRLLG